MVKYSKSKLTQKDAQTVNTVARSGAELKDVELENQYGTSSKNQSCFDSKVISRDNRFKCFWILFFMESQGRDYSSRSINEGLRLGTVLGKKPQGSW